MKRSLFRVGAALATLALAGTLAACSNNSSSSSSDTPAGPASASADPAAPPPVRMPASRSSPWATMC